MCLRACSKSPFLLQLYHFGSAFVSPPRCILFQYTFLVLPWLAQNDTISLRKRDLEQALRPRASTMKKTIILDNYDSFTFNLYQYFQELGGNPVVFRNDE